MADNRDNYLNKFQELLRTLFQFEASDLDFGIYRILNYKRDLVEKFINEGLVDKVEKAFNKYKEKIGVKINEEFKHKEQEVRKALGADAITPTGDIAEQFKEVPIAKEYLEIRSRKEELENIDDIKSQVYNDLYSFFSRYYEDGDFVPHYRYSIKSHKYAIPYNGEEVKLYWANYSQYYVKTGELFRDYTFNIQSNYKGVFRVVEAREELGSNKATKERFFVLDDEEPVQVEDKKIIIRFQYRELTEDEVKQYGVEGGSNISKQGKINDKICRDIIDSIKDLYLKNALLESHKNEKSLLLYQLNRFTRKNTSDYFIHKNLKKFLTEQLDYFIKSDVLSIDTLEEEKNIDKHITRAKLVREIGEEIIDFLSQIEDFQKRLWEKKKFVIRTEYVITTDRVPEEFYSEIYSSSEQRKEWEELGFAIPDKKEKLKDSKLPIDTKHFSSDFKERLLEKLSEKGDIDDLLDGLLIKSENYQALNLIMDKYKGKIQTIYIDPPFNKETDADYLYNVKYKDSTWASMLENRLLPARDLLSDRGSIFVRCDYNGNWIVRPVMNDIFGAENFRNEIVVTRTKTAFYLYAPPSRPKNFSQVLDSVFWYSKLSDIVFENLKKGITPEKRESYWKDFKTFYRREENRYELLEIVPEQGCSWMWKREESLNAIENYKVYKKDVEIKGITLEEYWIQKGMKLNFLKREGNTIKYWVPPVKFISHNNWTDIEGYAREWDFPTENSEILLKRVIESNSNKGDLVMDFFLGSGTTDAVAHKLGRKWVGVEMGDHFWTVVLPRMKKVLAYDKSGISKDQNVKKTYNEKTAGGFFKYQVLEQYEDSLDNIELKENLEAQELFKDDYLLKYFLDFETRESPCLLNLDMLKNPFAYKLKVNLSEVGEPEELVVDIPETFAYLLGMKVKKIKARKDNGRKYLFMLGEKESQNCAIVLREYDDKWEVDDFANDKEFIKQELKDWQPNMIYVNGQCTITSNFDSIKVDIRSLEDSFKRLMEATYYGHR